MVKVLTKISQDIAKRDRKEAAKYLQIHESHRKADVKVCGNCNHVGYDSYDGRDVCCLDPKRVKIKYRPIIDTLDVCDEWKEEE